MQPISGNYSTELSSPALITAGNKQGNSYSSEHSPSFENILKDKISNKNKTNIIDELPVKKTSGKKLPNAEKINIKAEKTNLDKQQIHNIKQTTVDLNHKNSTTNNYNATHSYPIWVDQSTICMVQCSSHEKNIALTGEIRNKLTGELVHDKADLDQILEYLSLTRYTKTLLQDQLIKTEQETKPAEPETEPAKPEFNIGMNQDNNFAKISTNNQLDLIDKNSIKIKQVIEPSITVQIQPIESSVNISSLNKNEGDKTSSLQTLSTIQSLKLTEDVSQKIGKMDINKFDQHFIQLEPPEFGSMEIKIKSSDEQKTIGIIVNNKYLKDALAFNIIRLSEILLKQGFTSVNLDVKERNNGDDINV